MEIRKHNVTVADLVAGYTDRGEDGVVGYGGRLDIRPPYQREFVYEHKDQVAVIDSVVHGFPLNVMYWADREDGTYEVIDGQQRTISLARYVDGDFSYDKLYMGNLTPVERERIMTYPLMVYVCNGDDREKLRWFETVNKVGKELTPQELRNAVYSGSWVSDAKRYFSRTGCPAYKVGNRYVKGRANRQEYLQAAIDWDSGGNIEDHMARHQHKADAKDLWDHFRKVIDWVEAVFTNPRPKIMRGVDWGALYRDYHDADLDPVALEKRVRELIIDDEVQDKSGIYPYLLTGDKSVLKRRQFSEEVALATYEEQDGKCARCGKSFAFEEMEADHIVPWSKGGKTTKENCQMLCRECNRKKGAK